MLLLLSLLDHNPQLLLDQKRQGLPNGHNPRLPLPDHDPQVFLLDHDSGPLLLGIRQNASPQTANSTFIGTVQARTPFV